MIWSSVPPTNHKTTTENIISSRPDVKAEFSNATKHLSAWNVFFNDDIISGIVISTNEKIKPKVDLVENNDNFYYIKYTDWDEVKAFIV